MKGIPHVLGRVLLLKEIAYETGLTPSAAGSSFFEFARATPPSLKIVCRVNFTISESSSSLECKISSSFSESSTKAQVEKNKLKLLEYEVKSVIRPLLFSQDNIALDFHIFGPPSSILLSSLLSSAGAALLDANIDMKTVLVSASAFIPLDSGPPTLWAPENPVDFKAHITLASDAAKNQILFCSTVGELDFTQLEEITGQLSQVNKQLYSLLTAP